MPRDSSGNYSLPNGYLAITGQTISANQHNPALEDLGQSMTGSLPRNGSAPMLQDMPMGGFKVTGMAAGTSPTDATNKGQVDALMPIGAVIDFAGATPPTGWLVCGGQAINRVTYVDLFTIIGTTYGIGDGATTFNLPDLRGRVIAGKDDMGGTSANRLTGSYALFNGDILGASGGSESHLLTVVQMPNHNHGGVTGASGAHSHTDSFRRRSSGSGQVIGPADFRIAGDLSSPEDFTQDGAAAPTHTHTIAAQGNGGAHPNVQPTIVLNKIIKTGV